jgi:anti-sigma regulatory factor (Ser/Thr protein kinase)
MMAAPYPDRETAAHMLAEEIQASDMLVAEGEHSEMAVAISETWSNAIHHAAWLLDIEDLVDDLLNGRSK